MTKPADRINVGLVGKCVEQIKRLDGDFAAPEDSKNALKAAVMEEYGRTRARTERHPARKHLPKKLKIAIIAAIIAALIAGVSVYAFTDIFKQFFNDPREILEWEYGESHLIGDYEMTVLEPTVEFDTIDQLRSSVAGDYIIPESLPEEYVIGMINYEPMDGNRTIFTEYYHNNNTIYYKIDLDRSSFTDEDFDQLEKLVTNNGNVFYMVDFEDGYQGMAKINGLEYYVTAESKNELINFIKKAEDF